jgi:hypothetical protein
MFVKPFMRDFGFGHRDSRHIIVESEGKLRLGFASEGALSFMPSAGGGAGQLEISLMYGGNSAQYTYTATESVIELSCEHGSAKIAIEPGTGAVRFAGKGVALRLDAKSAPQFATSLNTERGVELSIGGGRYLFAPLKGKVTFDDTWILAQFHSVTPVLDLEPENGEFELAAYDLPADTEPVKITKTLEEVAADSAGDFKAFREGLADLPPEWEVARDNIAYLMWLGHRTNAQGAKVIVGNKLNSPDTEAWLQAVVSLPFKDADAAVDFILALPPATPPIQAIAVLRLLEGGMLDKAPRSMVYKLYNAINDSVRWWINNRYSQSLGLFFYAYRYETGTPNPTVFKVGEPVASPDINAYIILAYEVLSKLAALVLDSGETVKWSSRIAPLLSSLLSELWDGETFVAVNVHTGAKSEPHPVLSYMPLVLGARLPGYIVSKLAGGSRPIDAQAVKGALGTLAVMGLRDAGFGEDWARDLTIESLKTAADGGLVCPYYGAAVLALAGKTL